MWKQKLRPAVAAILRRKLRFPSLSPLSLYSAASESRLSPTFSSSRFSSICVSGVEQPGTLRSPGHHFPENSAFCRKNFCSGKLGGRCWNCSSTPETRPFLVCDSCRSVQPLDPSVDYFQIFGLEKEFDIEDKNLEGKYKAWQKKLHPDLVHFKSEREREYAAAQSARVIDAYRTLTNPLARAIYILNLEGVDMDEEQTVSDPDLLAEIMEIREAVEEATDSQALNQIQAQTQDKLKQWSESFANAFRSEKYEEARTSIQRMTYYKRVNEEIVKKL